MYLAAKEEDLCESMWYVSIVLLMPQNLRNTKQKRIYGIIRSSCWNSWSGDCLSKFMSLRESKFQWCWTFRSVRLEELPPSAKYLTVHGVESERIFEGSSFVDCSMGFHLWCYVIHYQRQMAKQISRYNQMCLEICTSESPCMALMLQKSRSANHPGMYTLED